MRILIDNSGYSLKNMGDIAMLQVALQRIDELIPAAECHVLTNEPERLSQYCPTAIPVPQDIMYGISLWLQPWNILGLFRKLTPHPFRANVLILEHKLRANFPRQACSWISYRYRRRDISPASISKFLSFVCSMDCVVATGGGYITDTFSVHAINVLNLLSLAQKLKLPTFLFGQGLGPIHDTQLKALCKTVFPKLNYIGLREERTSLPLALSLGAPRSRTKVTGDDAIELSYSKAPNQLGNKIGINLRVADYSQVNNESINVVGKVLQKAYEKLEVPYIPIPISFHEEDSDIRAIERLLPNPNHDINFPKTTKAIIEQIGQCRLVVTGSYHAGVFALSQGVSVVGLANSQYYTDKFQGLAKQFTAGCSVITMSNNNFHELLLNTIIDSWKNALGVRSTLLNRCRPQIIDSKQGYNILRTVLKG